MPIILAIEPDRRQRDALTAVVRQRVGAELILADTTEHALEAIGNRVPDLVLVPALLSPQDDAALAAALRVIAAAAHVRTLTIPVLAAHTAEAKPSGLLSRWRRGRTESQATDGCDPAVFAEQISAYLKESAAERAQRVFDEDNLQDAVPSHAQEFGTENLHAPDANVRGGAEIYVTGDGQAYVPFEQADVPSYEPPVMQTYEHTETPAYEQPVAAYARADVQPLTEPAAASTQSGVQDYIPTEVETYSQSVFDTYAPPAAPAYQQPDVPLYSPRDVQVDVPEESLFVETADYGATGVESDGVSAQELDQEEDIDLSGELAGLEPEESNSTRRDFDTELFDGEPVGVYTMDLEIDGTDVDVNGLDARGSFAKAKAEAVGEPAFASEAIAEFEFEADADVDAGSLAPFAAPEVDRHHDRATTIDGEAAFARAFEDEEVAGVPIVQASASETVEDIDTGDAEPTPTDAEPWVGSLFLSPRFGWPAMEGVSTEHPSAPAAAEAVAAVAKPTPARIPAVAAARPAPAPAVAEPRHAPAHKRPEWGELVASLRKDIERRRVEPPQEKAKPKPNPNPNPNPDRQPAVVRRSKQAKPIQDEWGFFDPEQCGFAALLAKLDEITEDVEDVEVRRS